MKTRFAAVYGLLLGFSALGAEPLISLQKKWNEFIKVGYPGKEFYSEVEVPFFEKHRPNFEPKQTRADLRNMNGLEQGFQKSLTAHFLRQAVKVEDYATIQLCLESCALEAVGYQHLGYFLACQKDPMIFKTLFAACRASISNQTDAITESLLDALRFCFRECRKPSLSPAETLKLAEQIYAREVSQYFLVSDATQVSLPPDQTEFDLKDFSEFFKKTRDDFKRRGLVWPSPR